MEAASGRPGVISKREWRSRIRASRAARSPQERARAAIDLQRAAAAAGLSGMVTAGYIPTPGEPDIGAVLDLASAVLLPVPLTGRVLAWAHDDGTRGPDPRLPVSIPGSEPVGVGAAALLEAGAQLLLLPALAVARDGVRLGQGGGFYDHLLGQLEAVGSSSPRVVAVVFEDELLDAGAIPAQDHDVAVTEVLVPSGLVSLGGPSR